MPSSFQGTVVTPIVSGDSTTNQSHFALSNNWGSLVDVDIRRVCIQNDPTDLITTLPMPIMRTFRIPSELITGGIILSKSTFDTNFSSSTLVEARCNVQFSSSFSTTPADYRFTYSSSNKLIEITGSNALWQQYTNRMVSLIGQVTSWDNSLLPRLIETTDFFLHPGESLLVEIVAPSPDANLSTLTNAWVQVMWEEFPASSSVLYSVSGITKDSASVALGSCDVYLMRKLENGSIQYVTKSISDSVTGEYSFLANSRISTYFVIARKEGTPNVFDVTDFTLTPVNI
jgi:hypothetical protein